MKRINKLLIGAALAAGSITTPAEAQYGSSYSHFGQHHFYTIGAAMQLALSGR